MKKWRWLPMTKMRVYELARELKLDSKEILKVSTDLGFEVKNHMSNLDSGQVQAVRKALAKPAEKSRPAKPKSSQTAQAKQAPSPL
ncbi:MAG TPA: hypothetical protein DG577_03120, partial [Firmicutes bacterium]|nr:hypothetical protein [Bacillota bacterium]